MGMLKDTKVIEPTALPVDYRNEWQKTGGGGIYLGDLPDDGLAYALQVPFPDAHDFVFNQLSSKSTRNHAGISDPQLDAMIERQSGVLDEVQRVQAVKEIVAYTNEKAYMAPVMQGPGYFGLQPWVKGYTLGITYGWATESFINAFVVR
jgi:ABC-type transport system substrate-binding protein